MIAAPLALALLVGSAWPHCSPAGCVAFAPFDDVTASLVDFIGGAHTSLRIAEFNISSLVIADAIVARARAGVDVEVLIDFSRPDNEAIARLVAEPRVRFARVPSLRGGGPQMHEKTLLRDGADVVFGTGNLTEAALSSSVETFLETTNPDVVAGAAAELDALVSRTKLACAVFAARSPGCPWGGAVAWDKGFDAFARTGRFRPPDIVRGPKCASFAVGKEKLEAWPVDRARSDLAGCLTDPRFAELARRLPAPAPPSVWTRARGLLVADPLPPRDPARAPIRLLSSRTDDIEELLLAALAAPRAADAPPPEVSLSRLHDKNLIEALAREGAVVTVGSFLHTDAAGTTSGELVLAKLPQVRIAHDGFLTAESLFHDKTALIDGRVWFSSANWSAQAFARSDETFLLVDDPALVGFFRDNLARARALATGDSGAEGTQGSRCVVVVVVPVPAGADPRAGGALEITDRTATSLRYDGGSPAALVGAVEIDRAVAATVVVGAQRATVTLVPRGVASRVDVVWPLP